LLRFNIINVPDCIALEPAGTIKLFGGLAFFQKPISAETYFHFLYGEVLSHFSFDLTPKKLCPTQNVPDETMRSGISGKEYTFPKEFLSI